MLLHVDNPVGTSSAKRKGEKLLLPFVFEKGGGSWVSGQEGKGSVYAFPIKQEYHSY